MSDEKQERLEKIRLLQLKREKEKRICEKSYSAFVKSAWPILEPDNELVWNWHLEYICNEVQEQLENLAAKKPRKYHLVVNVPPRSLKTYLLTRMPAAWAWIHWPALRFMRGSYSEELALEHAVETRDIIQSDWYQENWGDRFQIKHDQNNKSLFKTNKNGHCVTTSTSSKGTGRGADVVSIDDPISSEQAESETERNKCIRWFKRTLKSRLNNKECGLMWIIQQRLHENDLTGHVITIEKLHYKHICLPAEDCEWVNPPELRKFYTNGLLFPEKFSKEFLDNERISDPYSHAGQYQQRPSPEEGGVFKRQNWRFWKPAGMDLPQVTVKVGLETHTCITEDLPSFFDDSVCSWDMSFKDKKTNDPVSGHVVALRGIKKYFLDESRGRWDFTKSVVQTVQLKQKYPMTSGVLIEDKANGTAIMAELKGLIPGIIEVPAEKSKFARALPMSKQQFAGNIYLPHPAIAPWVMDFIEEYAGFPNGAHDDRVDSGDQAVNHLTGMKKVWPIYRPNIKRLNIGWRSLSKGTSLICSQYVDHDLKTSILLGLWNAQGGKLTIFDNLEMSSPIPEFVIPVLNQMITRDSAGVICDMGRFDWYGNDLMFAKASVSTRSSMMKDGIREAYVRSGVYLIDNSRYDEYGAITLVSTLLLKDGLSIDMRCHETSRQMNAWCFDGKEPGANHGLARALCNMVSVLWTSGKMQKVEHAMGAYSQEKEQYKQAMETADKQGRLTEFIVNKSAPVDQVRGVDGWMGV